MPCHDSHIRLEFTAITNQEQKVWYSQKTGMALRIVGIFGIRYGILLQKHIKIPRIGSNIRV
jgi:hypothetical protein